MDHTYQITSLPTTFLHSQGAHESSSKALYPMDGIFQASRLVVLEDWCLLVPGRGRGAEGGNHEE